MNDTSVEMLVQNGLDGCHTLEYLNLSLNSISCRGVDVMSSYFNSSSAMSLKSLILHWNRIRGRGAVRLFKLLSRGAKNLRELDLSFNSIGQFQALGQPKQANTQNEDELMLKEELNKFRQKIPLSIYKLGRFLAKNDQLQHLDVSFCGIEGRDSIEFIANQLEKNTTLLGIHIQRGNCLAINGMAMAKA